MGAASTHDYYINDYKLQWSSCTRDHGIYIDNDLKFAQHISKITHIGHSRVALITRIGHSRAALITHIGHSRAALILKCFLTRDPKVLLKTFFTYVRPIL